MLDDDATQQLGRRGVGVAVRLAALRQWLGDEQRAEAGLEQLGHHLRKLSMAAWLQQLSDLLLIDVAVVFDGDDERIVGGGKGELGHDRQHVAELDLGRERVAVVHDGVVVGAVPAVDLDAAAAVAQAADVRLDRRLRPELVAHQVPVARISASAAKARANVLWDDEMK